MCCDAFLTWFGWCKDICIG